MKKITETLFALIIIGSSAQASSNILSFGGNFTALAGNGSLIGGTNDVAFTWDGTLNNAVAGAASNATISSDEAFFGVLWNVHDVTLYGPGSYTIYDGCDPGDADCGVGNPVNFNVTTNQVGAHILFDYPADATNIGNINMDIINVWNLNTTWDAQNPTNSFYTGLDNGSGCTTANDQPDCVIDGLPNTSNTIFGFTSTDFNNDGTAGSGMSDGAFVGSYFNFNLTPIPAPPAILLFGTGLLGLVGIAKRKKAV